MKKNNIGIKTGNLYKILQSTRPYEEWLIHSLRNKKEAATYLQVALYQYQNDGDLEAFLLALRHIEKTQGDVVKLEQKTDLNR